MTLEIFVAQSFDEQLLETCGEDPGAFCKTIYTWTENEAVTDFLVWFVEKPLRIIFIFVIAFVLNRVVRKAIGKLVAGLVQDSEKKRRRRQKAAESAAHETMALKLGIYGEQDERASQRAETLGAVLRSIATVTIYGLAIAFALIDLGVSLGPLIAGAGILGLALGFGAQSLVKDFLTGMFIVIEDQYGVGDSVDVGEASGVVEEVSLRVTKIRDVNGTLWFIPNGEIRRVANKSQLWARAVMDIDVAYDTDLKKAAAVIKSVADEVWREEMQSATILEEPQIWGVENFGADSISIRLVVKTDPSEQWTTAREIRGRLKAAFDEHGIEMPFAQRTVWLKNGDETVDSSPSGVLHVGGSAPPTEVIDD